MTVTIRDLKNRLSEYLRRVQAGEPVIVTDHGRPIARVVPLEPADLTPEQRLERMAEAGEVTPPRGAGRMEWTRPTRIRGRPLSSTLLEDRE